MFHRSECDGNLVVKVKDMGGGYKFDFMFEELNIAGMESNFMTVAVVTARNFVFKWPHYE